MRNVTVNISFQDALLAEIDAEAKRESRTRSELLREAARLYVRRQSQWERVFALGDELSKQRSLTKTDVVREIRNVRRRENAGTSSVIRMSSSPACCSGDTCAKFSSLHHAVF